MKIEKTDGCMVSEITIDGELFFNCSDTKLSILKERLIGYLTERVQSKADLNELLEWTCDMYGTTRHEYHCEQCGDDVYTTALEL